MEPTSAFVVSNSALTTVTTAITENLAVLLPVGLTILGIVLAVSLIPRIIYKFF